MTLLPGAPLRGSWPDRRVDRLADAMRELWSVPVADLSPIDMHATDYWADLFARTSPPEPGPLLLAYELVGKWLHSDMVAALLGSADLNVLGQGDPQVGNMLYDQRADRFRLVDFEDAGPSEPAFELANFAEHLGTRDTGLDRLVDRFSVDQDRFDGYRRLQAGFWFLHLLPRRAERADDVAELADRIGRLLG
jgi:thiamine kinase-like enzyme